MADEKKKSNPLLDLEIEEMVGGLAGQKMEKSWRCSIKNIR